MEYVIKSPVRVIVGKYKIALNLNRYRNLHYQLNNKTKQMYNLLLHDQLIDIKIERPVRLELELYRKGRRIVDSSNTYCIVEKFFCDAMVKYGCIPDDNDNFIFGKVYKKTVYKSVEEYCIIKVIEVE